MVVSNANAASADPTPLNPETGNKPEISGRALQPLGEPTTTPSISTVTLPPPGTSARRAPRASTQPKLVYELPATVSPGEGVSMVPNGCVALLFAQVTVRVPTRVERPSASSAYAWKRKLPLPSDGSMLVSRR